MASADISRESVTSTPTFLPVTGRWVAASAAVLGVLLFYTLPLLAVFVAAVAASAGVIALCRPVERWRRFSAWFAALSVATAVGGALGTVGVLLVGYDRLATAQLSIGLGAFLGAWSGLLVGLATAASFGAVWLASREFAARTTPVEPRVPRD